MTDDVNFEALKDKFPGKNLSFYFQNPTSNRPLLIDQKAEWSLSISEGGKTLRTGEGNSLAECVKQVLASQDKEGPE